MSTAKRVLALHEADSDLSPDDLAAAAGCTSVYAARVLRRAAGLEVSRPRESAVKHRISELARTTGLSGRAIAEQVGCDPRYAELVSSTARAEVRGDFAQRGDKSTPKFAHDDEHVAAVMREGGFCALSERHGPRGHVAVCLPMVWPRGA